MTAARSAALLLALMAAACSPREGPSENAVRAAAGAARQAVLEKPPYNASGVLPTLPTKPCSVTIANGEPHSSLAQMVLQEASLAIQASEELSISGAREGDLELHLFSTERAEPRSRVWDNPPSPHHASGPFYIAYVVLGKDHRYLAGDLVKCKGVYKECGELMATRTLRVCQSRKA
jgi:hypothetical protein